MKDKIEIIIRHTSESQKQQFYAFNEYEPDEAQRRFLIIGSEANNLHYRLNQDAKPESLPTTGEWQAERGESGGYVEWFVRRDGDSRAIASDILDPETGEPSEDNTRLIAAAPELLEALKTLADYPIAGGYALGPCISECDMKEIRAAIDKAEGRVE